MEVTKVYRNYIAVQIKDFSLQIRKDVWDLIFTGDYYFVPFGGARDKDNKDKIMRLKKLMKDDPRALGLIKTGTDWSSITIGILVIL